MTTDFDSRWSACIFGIVAGTVNHASLAELVVVVGLVGGATVLSFIRSAFLQSAASGGA